MSEGTLAKQEAYERATLENLGDPAGMRQDIIYAAMDIYAKQQAIAFQVFVNDCEYSKDVGGGVFDIWSNPHGFKNGTYTAEQLYNLFKSKP